MSDFNYKTRIPTNAEYDRLMNITDEDDSITHWDDISSWVDDPEFIAKNPTCRSRRGYYSARYYSYDSADYRHVSVGFRPAFESLSNDTLPAGAADGDVVVIGTLYMDGKPIRIPQNPVWKGGIEDFIPGAKLEFKPALEDPAYQVKAIKCGDVFVCDRCLLKRISYEDIESSFPMPAKHRYLVFLKADHARDTQGCFRALTDDIYMDDEAWIDVSGPVLLFDGYAESKDKVLQKMMDFYLAESADAFSIMEI